MTKTSKDMVKLASVIESSENVKSTISKLMWSNCKACHSKYREPLLIPVVPFGIILGAIGIELGFSAFETFATSFIIFGGASQIVFLQLLSGGASQIIAVSSAFAVNSRMLED